MKKKHHIVTIAYDKRGRRVAVGKNQYTKSNTWQKSLSIQAGMSEERIFIHSEVACLIKVKNLKRQAFSIKIERYDSCGNPVLAFPCLSCQLAIKLSGVKIVYFTQEGGIGEWIV